MIIEDRIKAFKKLGDFLIGFSDGKLNKDHHLDHIIQALSLIHISEPTRPY